MTNRAVGLALVAALLAFSMAFAGDNASESRAKEMAALAKMTKKSEAGAFLGIVPEEVTSDVANDYGVSAGQGVLVEQTVDGSPADEARLRANDILVSINGSRLTGPSELRVQLKKYKEGDEVALVYMRGGKERTANVKLEDSGSDNDFSWNWGGGTPVPPIAPHAPHVFKWDSGERSTAAFAGIVTQELSDGLKSYFKVEGGALISEVVEKSPADKAGLKAGDIITKIGTESVEDQSDVSEVIRDLDPDQTVDFYVIREGKSMVVPVTLTNRKDFYGDASEDGMEYAFTDEDTKELQAEMEKLHEELKSMGVELESLPDVKWEMKIDTDNPRVYIGSGEARAISADRGWWNWSFQDLRERIKVGMDELKQDLNTLKGELKQLQLEIKDRMSGLWTPRIDVAPQA
ncbi:MAG: PDZ domain-containing protein [bacterium]|nr:PDZ domain-containing protein [bacterium]